MSTVTPDVATETATVTKSKILTVDNIPKFIQERLGDLKGPFGDSIEGLEVSTIEGGNVNYAFYLNPQGFTKGPVFLKQAPEFVAIFGDGPDGVPLTSQRMQREMDAYFEWSAMLGDELAKKYLPKIFYFDKNYMAVLMEFFFGFTLLDHVLVSSAGEYHADVATCLGDFVGKTHAKTHSSKVTAERKHYLVEHFENREMRDIQLEYVFTKCYQEATEEQRAGLDVTPDFLKEVELLKKQYNGDTDSLVLSHGDLHPGSVMVDTKGNTKIIDPEFTVYGPPGLDVGSLLSGYCLGAIHQVYAGNKEAANRIVDGAGAIWDAYKLAMEQGGIESTILKDIEIETVGFTVAEVCRTALEFAGGRKWLQFEDQNTKASAKKAALRVVNKCMIARHEGGIDLLLKEMKAEANAAIIYGIKV